MTIFLVFGSVEFDTVFAAIAENSDRRLPFLGMEFNAIELIPVSALIHAATMVTAGVFLVCRAYPIFDMAPMTSGVVTAVGAFTALFAATVALVQNDIKRVIAYSTCSQLGLLRS